MARSINEKVNTHLQAALDSLERERAGIDEQIRAIRLVLGATPPKASTAAAPTTASAPDAAPTRRSRKRKLSAEARARIAAAQKKRWAEFRKKKTGSDS
ncbi:MAG: hypothetical protein IT162_17520 [Bryobacterales bacterium]|nr:hypothetical protein [Bryobacterales bacterium]